jgi:hypothetical protein
MLGTIWEKSLLEGKEETELLEKATPGSMDQEDNVSHLRYMAKYI